VDAVRSPWARRRAQQQLVIVRARQALVSLPDIHWHDPQSEEQARQQLYNVAAEVDRALGGVRAGSDEARALKYAQAWLTAWLQGSEDPALIPAAHAAPMYERLVAAMHTISLRLTSDGDADPPPNPDGPEAPS
jgi:hypothetical protein